MTSLMRAVIAYKLGKNLAIENIPIPTIDANQILIKLEACGVCHTDLHAVHGDWPVKPQLPLIPGHEGIGVIVAIGSHVKGVYEGDRVGVPWLHTACGFCEYCLTGWETLCHQQKNTGYNVNGCFAEYVVADPHYVVKIPQQLDSYTAAPILCAGLTVYKGLKEAGVKPGEWIVISGIGGLGHLAVQYAKAMGLYTVAIDIDDKKLALAKKLGSDIVINAAIEDPVIKINEEIKGAHGVLVTAVSTIAFSQAVAMLRRKGTVSLVGLPPGNFELSIFDIVLNRKTIRGSIVGTRMDLIECLNFAAMGKVEPIYKKDKLDNINTIFENLEKGKIEGRIVLAI